MRLSLIALALPLGLVAAPALAQHMPPPPQDWRDAPPPPPGYDDGPGPDRGYDRGPDWDEARARWLDDCHHRMSARRGDGTTGALVGAAVGGVVGNVVAGRGNRLGGTLIGAGVGAVGGALIDRAASHDRRAGNYCEAYLERSSSGYGRPGYGYGEPVAYGYAYQPMVVMVPVAMQMMVAPQPAPRPKCREVVTYETVIDYVPAAHRYIPPRPRPVYTRVPDKRIRLVPDKRIPTG